MCIFFSGYIIIMMMMIMTMVFQRTSSSYFATIRERRMRANVAGGREGWKGWI